MTAETYLRSVAQSYFELHPDASFEDGLKAAKAQAHKDIDAAAKAALKVAKQVRSEK